MSKTTKNHVRVCLITVANVDWQFNLYSANTSMSRLYSATARWESRDLESGELVGILGQPVSLFSEKKWSDAILSVMTMSHLTDRRYPKGKDTWSPIFLVKDGGSASRICNELRSLLCKEQSSSEMYWTRTRVRNLTRSLAEE